MRAELNANCNIKTNINCVFVHFTNQLTFKGFFIAF